MDHYRKLERMYHGSPCNDHLDIALSVTDAGEAEIRLGVDESDHHAAGGVHGSYYFKALDDATFFAANSLVEDVFVLTTDFHLQLTQPVTEGDLVAEATVVNDHPKQLIADGVLYDDEGTQLARGTGTFAKSRVELDAEMGYE
jgi:uncharacterized protein (TIGR00369 family)